MSALWNYKHLLEEDRFNLQTGNKGLTWLQKVQDERDKLSRWVMYFVTIEFDVEHVRGKNNDLPDALGLRSSGYTRASAVRGTSGPA